MLDDYVERFLMMVKELQQHPKVVLLNAAVFPPASETMIQSVEQSLGYPLDEAIRSFYRQTNGLQLRWIHTANSNYDPALDVFDPSPFDWSLPERDFRRWGHDTACINILPIDQAFLKDWYGHIWSESDAQYPDEEFAGKSYSSLQFSQHIQPFDVFNEYYQMAFFLGEPQSSPPVILGDDHGACFTDSRITDFASYLEFLLVKRGIIDARKPVFYHHEGHREPPLIMPRTFWSEADLPDLDDDEAYEE